MKSISVTIKDKNTLILDEDASKGDYIDLKSLTSISFDVIEGLINEGKDSVYEKKLSEFKKIVDNQYKNNLEKEKNNLKLEYEKAINNYKLEIEKIKYEKSNEINNQELKLKQEINNANKEYEVLKNLKNQEIEKLKLEIASLKENQNNSIEIEKLKIKDAFNEKIKELENTINKNINDKGIELKNQEIEFNKKISEIKEEYDMKLQERDNKINILQRQKSSLNVKQTGEDLEAWCDNEMRSYRQIGLFNTTWEKDNDVIKEEGETKGSKADFIFKIYASDKHLKEEEIASVCLEMKDENPDSVNKQTNEHYYKALERNRTKKNCKYALLVSNLEIDRPNDLPVWKVEGYNDMYVVRPAYMMSFLSMLTSLTVRFRDLILEGNKERLELINSIELKEKFEELKNRYLDKPLEGLSKIINTIREQSDSLKKISQKIDDECDKATKNYLNEIQNKLSRFDIEMEKSYKKFDKSMNK